MSSGVREFGSSWGSGVVGSGGRGLVGLWCEVQVRSTLVTSHQSLVTGRRLLVTFNKMPTSLLVYLRQLYC